MLDESAKTRILEEILESPEFRDSKRYKELLQYLFQETLAGRPPKEITIGSDFFRKESGFDPKEDPTVRVYLNTLRKKLDHYYLTSGAGHTHRLVIPKGHYQVDFQELEIPPTPVGSRTVPLWAALVPTALFAIVLLTMIIGRTSEQTAAPLAESPIWREFMTPGGRPTIVLLGDFFFLFERGPDGKARNFVRNIDVNSLDDFKAAVKNDPLFAERYVKSDFTFLRPSASWGLAHVLPTLEKSPNGFSLKLATQFTVDDLKTSNIVYLGSFKTLHNLVKFLHVFDLEYTLAPLSFTVRSAAPDSSRTFAPKEIRGGNYERDYAVVAKGGGPEGSTLLLLLGFSDTGVIEAARAVTEPDMVDTIVRELGASAGAGPSDFTMVVGTEGLNQSIFKARIEHLVRHPRSPAGGTSPPINDNPLPRQ